MNKNQQKRIALGAIAGAVLGSAALGVVLFADGDEFETPIQGSALERASAAALAFTGGGRVTETEEGDEESYYEVEVTFADGRQVDVQLDENFEVVGAEGDDEDGGDDD